MSLKLETREKLLFMDKFDHRHDNRLVHKYTYMDSLCRYILCIFEVTDN